MKLFVGGIDSQGNARLIYSANSDDVTTNFSIDKNKHRFILENGNQQLDEFICSQNYIGNTATNVQYMYIFASHVEWENSTGAYSQRCK